MSLVVGQQMTADQARALTDRIRTALTVAYDSLIEAWQGRADLALGYDTWDDYCSQEFAEGRMVRLDRKQRKEIVGQMRRAGMGTPAIGAALGVSDETARRDLSATSTDVEVGPVTGLNGKTYRPRDNRSTSEIHPEDEGDDESPLTQEECEVLAGSEPQKSKSDPPRQRPLSDVAKDAGWDLRRAVDRIERVLSDPRLTRNAEQVTNALRGHLLDAAERVPSALDRLSTNHQKGTVL